MAERGTPHYDDRNIHGFGAPWGMQKTTIVASAAAELLPRPFAPRVAG